MSEIVDGVIFSLNQLSADVEVVRDMQPVGVEASSQVLTGGSIADIFTITGGPILIEALIGEFDEAVSADPCDLKLVMDPSVGVDTDMCLVIDINGLAQYSYLYLDGVIGNAIVNAVPGTALPLGFATPLIVPRGTIDMNLANSDPTTGAITWYMRYRPLASGVVVTGLT